MARTPPGVGECNGGVVGVRLLPACDYSGTRPQHNRELQKLASRMQEETYARKKDEGTVRRQVRSRNRRRGPRQNRTVHFPGSRGG